jgi:tape measure domain-containing protein
MADKYTFSVDVETLNAIKKLRALGDEASDVGDKNEKAAKKASGSWETFKGVIGGAAVIGTLRAIGDAATGAFGAILESTKTTERIKTELEVMTGSVEAAEAAYANLQNFAATTPFQIEGIADAARQLIAFGFDSGTVTDKLRVIGDVASGSGSSLQDLTQIFGQVSAAGQLTGERFNQLSERAVPIGKALAETMGVAESAVKDLVSNGAVDFKTFEKAFSSLAQEGGLFFDGMNKKSQTLDGVLSTLADTFDLAASDIGQGFLPVLKEVVTSISETILANREMIKSFAVKFGESFTEFFRTAVEYGKAFGEFVSENRELLAFLGTALGVAAAGWGIYATAVTAASVAQAAFAAVNPVVLALGAATVAIAAAIRYWDELKIAFYGTIAAMAELASYIPGLGDSMKELAASATAEAEAIQAAKDAKAADAAATDELALKKDEAATAAITAKQKEVAAVDTLNKEERKKAEEHAKALAELKAEQRAQEEELRILQSEESVVNNDARLQSLIEQLGKEEAIRAEARLRYLEGEQQTTFIVREQELFKEEIRKKALERQIEDTRRTSEGLLTLQQEYDKKIADNEKKKEEDAKRKRIEERKARQDDFFNFANTEDAKAEWAEKTEAQKVSTVRDSFRTLAMLSKDGNKQLGEIGKAAAIAGATIDTYKAANAAYASLAGIPVVGPALATAAAAAAVVAGLANVRQIQSGRFERGGIVAGSSYTGDNITARVNSGELILNRAQQKNLAPQLMGQDNSDVVAAISLLREDVRSLQLTIGDEEVFNAVNRQVQSGRQL